MGVVQPYLNPQKESVKAATIPAEPCKKKKKKGKKEQKQNLTGLAFI